MAQEQQPREIQQTAGPYEVGVLTERSNLSVGRARFIITVDDPVTGGPVNGAEIVIRIKHQAEGTEGWAAAYSVPTFPGTYHAQTRFDSPGVYLVSIEIQGELGKGTMLVEPLNVPDLRGYSSGSFVFVGLTLVLVAGGSVPLVEHLPAEQTPRGSGRLIWTIRGSTCRSGRSRARRQWRGLRES